MPVAPVINLEQVCFFYTPRQPVLAIEAFHLERGESLFLEGPSGSGKSTLTALVAGILLAQKGKVAVCGQPLGDLGSAARDTLRADHIGYIFQLFNLIPWLSVRANIMLPLQFSALRRERLARQSRNPETEVRRLLHQLDLSEALIERPVTELSVGQQQRVAAARALLGQPELIIADEPTSALDNEARGRFVELLLTECQANEAALLFVSHDHTLKPLFDRAVTMAQINKPGMAS